MEESRIVCLFCSNAAQISSSQIAIAHSIRGSRSRGMAAGMAGLLLLALGVGVAAGPQCADFLQPIACQRLRDEHNACSLATVAP